MRVVNVRVEECTHYIGRGRAPSGINTRLGNPFGICGRGGHGRETVIELFFDWATRNEVVLEKIRALPEDAVLGCWCKPNACHGDAIVEIWKRLQALR